VGATSVSVGDAAITWEAGKPGTWSGAGQFLERIAPGAPAILADLIWREDYT
jgi:hypothetical protein